MAKGDIVYQEQNIAGTSSSYVPGDNIGTEATFTGFATAANGTGTITKITVWDDSDTLLQFDIYISESTITGTRGADSAAFAVSDTDNRVIKVWEPIPAPVDNGVNRFITVAPVAGGYRCAATSLFVNLVARSTMAAAIAASAIRVGIEATLTS